MLSQGQRKKEFSPTHISELLNIHYNDLMKEFYEMQSIFLSTRYRANQSLETSSIRMCFIRSLHLAIVRQRERNLDFDLSLKNFFLNIQKLNDSDIISHKIVSIVKTTGIPKETVRRKLKKLCQNSFVRVNKHKEYHWNLTNERKEDFEKRAENDIRAISKFISNISKYLELNYTQKKIEEEIKNKFSFYFFHFFNCQLSWFKMWQLKIKDVDLIFIAIQVLIPTLKYAEKNISIKNLDIDNLHTIIGRTNSEYKQASSAISASSISEISGIPRATCIRKLDKLVKLGLLIREVKTKRYFVNQQTTDRTKHIVRKENVHFTIQCFSDFLSIVITALSRK